MNKKIISTAICCTMVLSVFAACTSNPSLKSPSTSASASASASGSTSELPAREPGFYPNGVKQDVGTVATVGDFEVSFELFRYYFLSIIGSMQQEGAVDESKARELTLQYIKESQGVLAIAAQNNVALDAADEARIDEMLATQKSQMPSEEKYLSALSGMFMSPAIYRQMGIENEILSKLVKALYMDDIKQNVTDNYVHVKHILVQFPQDATDAQKEEIKTKAEGIAKQIADGAVFEDMITEHNEAPGQTADGYYFTKGEMVQEFEDKAFEMNVGDVSEPVLTIYGYHILKKYELENETIEKNATQYVSQAISDKLYNLVSEAAKTIEAKTGADWDKFTAETVS